MNFPSWFRSTPPIADFARNGWREASAFHFSVFGWGGDHSDESKLGVLRHFATVVGFHKRQWGTLTTSLEEYGKGSLHPLIHQLSLKRIRSCSCRNWVDTPSNNCAFLLFQIDHKIMKKLVAQTFLKKTPLFGYCHWSKASVKENGNNHETPHKCNHQHHMFQFILCICYGPKT